MGGAMRNFSLCSLSLTIISSLVLSACVTVNAVSADNRQKMNSLKSGMTIEEMFEVMGKDTGHASVANPFKKEIFRKGETNIEVYYYFTQGNFIGGVTDDELTPVLFIDEKLYSIGYRNLENTISKYKIEIRNR